MYLWGSTQHICSHLSEVMRETERSRFVSANLGHFNAVLFSTSVNGSQEWSGFKKNKLFILAIGLLKWSCVCVWVCGGLCACILDFIPGLIFPIQIIFKQLACLFAFIVCEFCIIFTFFFIWSVYVISWFKLSRCRQCCCTREIFFTVVQRCQRFPCFTFLTLCWGFRKAMVYEPDLHRGNLSKASLPGPSLGLFYFRYFSFFFFFFIIIFSVLGIV